MTGGPNVTKQTQSKAIKAGLYIKEQRGISSFRHMPCMFDRANQALWNLALLPVVEAQSDLRSYGFRPYRNTWHAYAQIRRLLSRRNSPRWVLDADIEKCFDTIDHDWLLENQ